MAIVFLLPATVVGHFLPADAQLSGPLSGFTVQFGGAAAIYFALMVIGIAYIADPNAHRAAYEVVTLEGDLVFEDEGGGPKERRLLGVVLQKNPHSVEPRRATAFELAFDLPVMRRPSGALDFGDLRKVILEYPCFGAVTIDLSEHLPDEGMIVPIGTQRMVPVPPGQVPDCSFEQHAEVEP